MNKIITILVLCIFVWTQAKPTPAVQTDSIPAVTVTARRLSVHP